MIANPVPKADEIPSEQIENALQIALKEAENAQISGKELTPFLLDNIRHITDGASLNTNRMLVRNNAILAAEIAKEIAAKTL